MKKTFNKIIVGMFLLIIALSGIACSREKTTEKIALPPEKAKMFEEYKKSVEESKKIIVIWVNGVEISLKELIDMMNQIAPNHIKGAEQRSPEIDAKVKKEALDTLVFRELAFQEATKQGIKVKTEDVDAAMRKLKRDLGSENAFKEYLIKFALTEASLRKQIERDQIIEIITKKEILLKSDVDEKLLRDTYKKEKSAFVLPETLLVEDVLFQTTKDNNDAAMNKAKETLALIKKNNNDLSSLSQDKTFVVRQGDVTKQEYPNIFQTAVKMKVGDLSGVIKESDGLHIVKLVQREPSRQLSFEESREEIEKKLMQSLINKRKQQWENELKKNAKIEITKTQDVVPMPENMKKN